MLCRCSWESNAGQTRSRRSCAVTNNEQRTTPSVRPWTLPAPCVTLSQAPFPAPLPRISAPNEHPHHRQHADTRPARAPHPEHRREARPLHRRRGERRPQGPRRRRGRLRPPLPRPLRGRHVAPRLPDPLLDHQRPRLGRRRARLRRLARHAGPHARARHPALRAGELPAGARLRRRRLQPAVRAAGHQRARHARPGRHPASRAPSAGRTTPSSSPAGRAPPARSRWPTSSTSSSPATARR